MTGPKPRLILFTRFPVAGQVKTRLLPALGAEGALALYRRLVLRTFRTAHALGQIHPVDLEIRLAGREVRELQHWLGDAGWCRPQGEGDLGQRMANAFADSFREGAPATVIIGSDCPGLTPEVLAAAFQALQTRAVVFGPATDGGYYLLGLTRLVPGLFTGIAWGTEHVLAQSLAALARVGEPATLLKPLADLDRPEDLAAWQRIVDAEAADPSRISVVIPALNEAAQLPATLASVQAGQPHEIIVVDGQSADDTANLARQAGATVIASEPGRARQMNAGAGRATGHVLLFLHADTQLPPGWSRVVADALQPPRVVAGAFRFRVAEPFAGRQVIEWATHLRSRWFQLPYGDQALFLRRATFEEMGGFEDLAIMEDYVLVRRLRRQGRMVTLAEAVQTSGRRWRRLGVIRTTLMNQVMVAGYHAGISPERLARWYRGAEVRR